jgi:hypothetical protein
MGGLLGGTLESPPRASENPEGTLELSRETPVGNVSNFRDHTPYR